MKIDIPADRWLTRKQTAAALTEEGLPTSDATLATYASKGGGPDYIRYGHITYYQWGVALKWARARVTKVSRPAKRRHEPTSLIEAV